MIRDVVSVGLLPVLLFCSVAAPPTALGQGPDRVVHAVEERTIDGKVSGPGFALVRAVLPTRNGLALISVAPRGSELRTIDSTGRTRWVRSFVDPQTPLGLAISGDTIAVATGTYVDAQIMLFLEGQERPVRVLDVGAKRGQVVQLLPSLAGPFLVRIENANEADGKYLRAVRNPRHEFFRVSAAGLVSAFQWADSAPRVLAPSWIPGATGSVSVQPSWIHAPTFTALNGHVFFVARNEYRIEIRQPDGVRSPIERRSAEIPLTQNDRAHWHEQWRAGPRGRLLADSVAAQVLGLPIPAVQPSARRLFVGADGGIAVERGANQRPRGIADSVQVDFFSGKGEYAGTSVLAPGLQIQAFTGTHLIASRISADPSGIVRENRQLPNTILVVFRLEFRARTG